MEQTRNTTHTLQCREWSYSVGQETAMEQTRNTLHALYNVESGHIVWDRKQPWNRLGTLYTHSTMYRVVI